MATWISLLIYGIFAVTLYAFLEWVALLYSNDEQFHLPWYMKNIVMRILTASVWPLVLVIFLFLVAEDMKKSRR